MDTTIKHTNGTFYEVKQPKINKESTCNLYLENLILKSVSTDKIKDFFDPDLRLYVYPVAWSNGSKSLECPLMTNDELAESAKMILSSNNTRELIEADIPMFELPLKSEDFEMHILLFIISFKENGIIRNKLFDKVGQTVKKSDLNKSIKRQSKILPENRKQLIEKLRKKIVENLNEVSEVKCFHYQDTCLKRSITLNHRLLHAKINTDMNEILRKAYTCGIPNLNGKRLNHIELPQTRDLLESVKESLAPLTLGHSVQGDIGQVLFSLPVTSKDEERAYSLSIITQLLKTMKGVEIIIIVEMDLDEEDAKEWRKMVEKEVKQLKSQIPKDINNTLTIIEKDIVGYDCSFSVWAQDAVIPAVGKDGKNYLLTSNKPKRTDRRNDGSIAISVAGAKPRYHFSDFDFQLEGGNMLVADDFILIGKDEILHNTTDDKYSKVAEDKFLENFEREIGDERPIFFVKAPYKDYKKPEKMLMDDELERGGELFEVDDHYSKIYSWRGTEQPIFHIDLFMTLLGYNEAGEYELLVGEPKRGFDINTPGIDADMYALMDYQVKDAKNRINESIQLLQAEIQNRLNIPLKIHRNPLPLTFTGGLVRSHWYWASYNNCIIQNGSNKTVWLPTYGHKDGYDIHLDYLKKYDIENYEAFLKLGYNAHLLDADFNFFAQKGGSLHCLSKSISRNISQTKLLQYG